MNATGEELARAVDAVLRAVPGVVAVYSARTLVARALRSLADNDLPLSRVEETADGAVITASVGVSGSIHTSAEVAAACAGAVHELVGPTARVRVRVSRVVLDSDD